MDGLWYRTWLLRASQTIIFHTITSHRAAHRNSVHLHLSTANVESKWKNMQESRECLAVFWKLNIKPPYWCGAFMRENVWPHVDVVVPFQMFRFNSSSTIVVIYVSVKFPSAGSTRRDVQGFYLLSSSRQEVHEENRSLFVFIARTLH